MSAPIELPGESVPPGETLTGPVMMPLPARMPPLTITAPLPVPDPLVLLTSSLPTNTVVTVQSAAPATPTPGEPTIEDAKKFVADVDKELQRLWRWGQKTSWVKAEDMSETSSESSGGDRRAAAPALSTTGRTWADRIAAAATSPDARASAPCER